MKEETIKLLKKLSKINPKVVLANARDEEVYYVAFDHGQASLAKEILERERIEDISL